MRSKRKEVNKYVFKAVEEVKETEAEDGLRRSTGIKPFQLVKIRQGQRTSFDLTHTNNEILHRRAGSNNLNSEEKEVYMNLIIQQKLLIDPQANQKLESERKNVIALDRETSELPPTEVKQIKSDVTAQARNDEEQIYTETAEVYCNQPSHQFQNEKKNNQPETSDQKRKRSKCHCCLQRDPTPSAKIRNKNQQNCIKLESNEPEESPEEPISQQTRLEVKAMKQRALPPFSFTSTKWRSKSEILQVDKWKEKYGKDMHQTQKIEILEKAASTGKFDKRSQKGKYNETNGYHSLENQKGMLPILHKSKELEGRAKIFKFSPSKREEREIIKIYNAQAEARSNYLLLSQDNPKKDKKSGSAQKIRRQNEAKNQIAIKKMYETEVTLESPPLIPTQAQNIQVTEPQPTTISAQKEKPKKKKSKFPEIQISTFYSTKEQEDERKRIRLESIQRLAREWRYNPPKKIYLQKMMEQIPEGWEYGESRDSSREVDTYLQHQQEEAKRERLIRQMQEKRLQQELELNKAEEDYLCNAELIVRQ